MVLAPLGIAVASVATRGAAGHLGRALADRLRARRPVPPALLRRADRAVLSALRARRRGCIAAFGVRVGRGRGGRPARRARDRVVAGRLRLVAVGVSWRTSHDGRILARQAGGSVARARTRPGETIYAMYADASLYFAADRPPAFKYLWFLGEQRIPGRSASCATSSPGRRHRATSSSTRRRARCRAPSRPGSRGAEAALPLVREGRRARRAAAPAALEPAVRCNRCNDELWDRAASAVSAIGLGCMGMSWAYGDAATMPSRSR